MTKCDFCGKAINKMTATACAWLEALEVAWICDECDKASEATYERDLYASAFNEQLNEEF